MKKTFFILCIFFFSFLLYACDEGVSYVVSFESNGGSLVPSIQFDGKSKLTLPKEPTKEGFTFDGWYVDEALLVPLDPTSFIETPIQTDIKLYAKWHENEVIYVTVKFNPMTDDDSLVVQVIAGTHLEFPDFTQEGYEVKGWFFSEDEGITFTDLWDFDEDTVTDDMTLYALWIIKQHTVTFLDGENQIEQVIVEYGQAATPPADPMKEGYTFSGWDVDFTIIKDNLTVSAVYQINSYDLNYYDEDKTTVIQSTTYEFGADLSDHQAPEAPEKEGYTFDGWESLPSTMSASDISRTASYTLDDVNHYIPMVQVGELGITYTIPTGRTDDGTATVAGGYMMATTQTTYEDWYNVRVWAEALGYHFQNIGREGNDGAIGAHPSEDNKLRPVTTISWRDVIVWSNALSEMTGLDPVYRTVDGEIIKDSRTANTAEVDAAVQTNNNGYRLPTSMEWEMAARWKNDTTSTNGSILVGGRYWTPGNYASGATANYLDETATSVVAYFDKATGGNFTRTVGQLLPNHLGIYDMSGNVSEWTYTTSGSNRVLRGGGYSSFAYYMQIGFVRYNVPYNTSDFYGFRLMRGQ